MNRPRSSSQAALAHLSTPCATTFATAFRDSSGATVAVVQSTQPDLRNHSTPISGSNSASRSLLPEAEVSSVFVVVAEILKDDSPQMAFVEGNDVVQQVTPAAFHPSLGNSILPGDSA
jgi:hypothetical protein